LFNILEIPFFFQFFFKTSSLGISVGLMSIHPA